MNKRLLRKIISLSIALLITYGVPNLSAMSPFLTVFQLSCSSITCWGVLLTFIISTAVLYVLIDKFLEGIIK